MYHLLIHKETAVAAIQYIIDIIAIEHIISWSKYMIH